MINAVYLPVNYEPAAGEIVLADLAEGFALMGLTEEDVISLPLPRSSIYMSRSAQLERDPNKVNTGATIVASESGLNIRVCGPALVVKNCDVFTVHGGEAKHVS